SVWQSRGRRLWQLPLVAHAAALFVLLLVVLPLSRPGTAAMSDEGAAILQARLLEHTGSWLLPPSLPSIDPQSHAAPFPRGDSGPRGLAPYARHPLYPVVLSGAHRLAGTAGYYLLGLL